MVMYGSTMFFITVAEQHARAAAHGLWTTNGIDPGTRSLAAGTATSGSVTNWLTDLTGTTHTTLLDEAAHVEPGASGLLLIPSFSGERIPVPDPRARGVLAGLTLSHGRAELYRAVLEGIAFTARHNLEALGVDNSTRVVAVGGGAGSDLWPQIVTDVTGIAQDVPNETIGACFGDARLAAEGVGLVEPNGSWATVERTFVPAPGSQARYEKLYEIYHRLRTATQSPQHDLAELQVADTAD